MHLWVCTHKKLAKPFLPMLNSLFCYWPVGVWYAKCCPSGAWVGVCLKHATFHWSGWVLWNLKLVFHKTKWKHYLESHTVSKLKVQFHVPGDESGSETSILQDEALEPEAVSSHHSLDSTLSFKMTMLAREHTEQGLCGCREDKMAACQQASRQPCWPPVSMLLVPDWPTQPNWLTWDECSLKNMMQSHSSVWPNWWAA